MSNLDYQALVNDLRVAEVESGGFHFVHLYDADDYDKFMLGEDEVLALSKFLNEFIKRHNLK
ncbi:MAG TPA: hypothetical protein VFQ43_19940 [Nitrososphaera sp.]|nr:hypothetical protein [Nitrososphaera sp.]